MYVLGISRVHDSAAALVRDGEIIAFAEEERFTRVKHDGRFPTEAIKFCLRQGRITLGDVDHVAYYWQRWREPLHAAKVFARYFPRTLEAFANLGGDGGRAASLLNTVRFGGGPGVDDYHVGGAVIAHFKRSFTLGRDLREAVGHTGPAKFRVHLVDHHRSHAASAFYISPFDSSAVLTLDGIGSDGTTTCLAVGRQGRITDLRRIKYPHSLGAMYAIVTGYLGFYPTVDEGKVMGLAAYGSDTYVEQFSDLVHLDPDSGGYELNLSWFKHHTTGKHAVSQKFIDTFGPPRPRTKVTATNPVSQHYADIAYALQVTLEGAGLHLARWLHSQTGMKRLCVAGGVALNSVMNGRILLETPFEEFFAQPAAADDGAALGAALAMSVDRFGAARPSDGFMFTGPEFGEAEIEQALRDAGVEYSRIGDIATHAAAKIANGLIVGWMQGRMECGPRALGNRSLLADPRDPESKSRMNEKVKHREPFRPFAPSCLVERAEEYFASGYPSPVMLLVFDVLEHQRNRVPAITHADGTARVQTVSRHDNPLYWRLISEFDRLTGVPMVLNTSFNDNNEPIVCTPADAISCYLKSDVDALAIGPFWAEKPRG